MQIHRVMKGALLRVLNDWSGEYLKRRFKGLGPSDLSDLLAAREFLTILARGFLGEKGLVQQAEKYWPAMQRVLQRSEQPNLDTPERVFSWLESERPWRSDPYAEIRLAYAQLLSLVDLARLGGPNGQPLQILRFCEAPAPRPRGAAGHHKPTPGVCGRWFINLGREQRYCSTTCKARAGKNRERTRQKLRQGLTKKSVRATISCNADFA